MEETIIYDKPFKTYDGMLDILESRNVIITGKDFAKECLSNISYYTLINGFKNLYEIDTDDKFIIPIPFYEFYLLYYFDMDINHILFKYIMMIEKSLKSKMSYIISKHYGVYTDIDDFSNRNTKDYLCRNNYLNSPFRNNTLRNIKNAVKEDNHNLSLQHYLEHHNHIPCWILTNCISFGLTIQWYQFLKKNEKNYICQSFFNDSLLTLEQQKEFLIKGLYILKNYRNCTAHGNIVFNYSIREILPKKQVLILSNEQVTDCEYRKGLCQNDIFAVVLVICTLLDQHSKKFSLMKYSK
ncbi:MAG: Abi family protein [Erysipelotrichaceae bacterium]|nr:Abi family protein [Erysipelotrichaceae bacterium]